MLPRITGSLVMLGSSLSRYDKETQTRWVLEGCQRKEQAMSTSSCLLSFLGQSSFIEVLTTLCFPCAVCFLREVTGEARGPRGLAGSQYDDLATACFHVLNKDLLDPRAHPLGKLKLPQTLDMRLWP